MDITHRIKLTPRQDEAVTYLISYPDQIQASKAMGVTDTYYRTLLERARRKAKVDNNAQLVHYWTIQRVVRQINQSF